MEEPLGRVIHRTVRVDTEPADRTATIVTDLLRRFQAALPARYKIDHELGCGSMGTVYLARESQPERQVAIKLLNPSVTARLARERFLREVGFASQLTHPLIVPVFSAGEAGEMLYYVMPYVTGETLRTRMVREGQLSLVSALSIAAEVADALAHAHRQNIVHRDIKPENILIHDEHALVTDFGIARAISAAESEPLTEPGMALGTPAYMSPERAGASEQIDGRADIYAVGCMLYEMIQGKTPYGTSPAHEVLRRQKVDPIPSLRTTSPDIPEAVDVALARALAKDPDDRYADAGEFARLLTDLRATVASGAKRALESAQEVPIYKRRGPIVFAVGLVAVLLMLWRLIPTDSTPLAFETGLFVDSVAVMPVENQTGDSTLDLVADAVTYDVIHELSRVEELKVTSLQSVRALAQAGLRPQALGDSLDVRLILTCSFRQSGGRVLVGAELIDATTDNSVWAERWYLEIQNEEVVESSVVERLVDGILTTAHGLDRAVGGLELRHGAGHEAYLQAQESLAQRTPAGLNRAIQLFGESIALDSGFAPAYAALSTAYTLALVYRYEIGVGGYEAAGRALAFANRAIELDPELASGYAARGLLASRSLGSTENAAADFRRAIELQPNAAEQPSWYAAVLVEEGRTAEAMASAERGVSLSPYSPARHLALALVAFELGSYDTAVREAHRVTTLEPEITVSRALEGRALLVGGRLEECLNVEFGPHDAVRATCLYELGRLEEAQAIIDSITLIVEGDRVIDVRYTDVTLRADLAAYHAWRGDTRSALLWLGRAFDVSPVGVWVRILNTDLFANLRNDPTAASQMAALTDSVWPRVLAESGAATLP